ncbi:hypothetical protein N7457_008532 [Penicillium paradoxum]|uniref:uncharacterized protein n=1 Tax=Penicillium paradoxum TaxID=176176 RepID=UPI0025467D83|nr:uncharacterized protein N7457_008532 [Penicillium paradoxum]KAJ5773636.1 hypothetical protein N7457_008532 [Penicillium paradoxum]
MGSPTDSSDTLITHPSTVHFPPTIKATATGMDLQLQAESPSSVVPKLVCEASDIISEDSQESAKGRVTLVLRRGRFRLLHQQQFKNSLLASVGYLELANAGDFAANVWNEVPVPRFAAILMGIGGTLALGMVLVAVQDFRLSWKNVKLLRAERAHLQQLQRSPDKDTEQRRLVDSRLGVWIREYGTEVVDRVIMDLLMGFGSMLVGIGTLMAIGGAHPRVFKASNLLSGYIGNGLAAFFGLINAIWSGYLVHRFHMHHVAACARQPSDDISRRLHTRFRRFQWHAGVNGINGLVAGAASMITAERWWGYVILIPCIISLILCNYFWREKLGYDRPLLGYTSSVYKQFTPLLDDLQYVTMMQRSLAESENSLPQTIVKLDSLESILRFIVRESMLETYCESLARDKSTRHMLSEVQPSNTYPDQIIISVEALLRLPSTHLNTIFQHAKKFMRTTAVRIFTHRERHLLELLGYAIYQDHIKATAENHDTLELT